MSLIKKIKENKLIKIFIGEKNVDKKNKNKKYN